MVERTSLDGTVSIVTGAGRQIGEGIAVELAAAGSDIVITDVDVLETDHNQQSSREIGGATRARTVADRIEDQGRRTHVVECDVMKADQVET
jgi:meso-butanediol dehydrogenase/(S,S)-butanediol dehydrogenase/diacetyl reductase